MDPVEVIQREMHQPLTRGTFQAQNRKAAQDNFLRKLFQSHGVKLLLAAEVVIEKRLVHACSFSDALSAGSGKPIGAKLVGGSLQDASARSVGAFGIRANWSRGGR